MREKIYELQCLNCDEKTITPDTYDLTQKLRWCKNCECPTTHFIQPILNKGE